ncbi:MAG: 50S ribosomal protein L1 [SAR202 cluster bacterium]|jgi:large subunit ribosomal protein L1|nr:50S ribosomal protein L1 [SAR202 cluster bacterium]MDP6300288.1 50S ribosomal protein L1 [SAR202 cluster bacterium]MDP7104447.1 50S ribosomal protein L1 [SAR202 cluster bacterium]MDP7225962.1 50S ribosomal protein L1 [SAR202 cluster bacterium]MDP7414493.1 50S ribosomal protein L1 [SAR202 cluster bacterium]|tara:strand:- start:8596 stop:9309 length:714 start_codon:yes stop_codon:yes gene_type:complete
MASRGKRYAQAEALIDREAEYEPPEAVALIKKTATAKFDETVELHLRTGADPRHADQMVRGVAILPHGVGKPVRTLVFTQGEAMKVAEDAGADRVGNDDVIKEIEDGWLEFDVSIATPDMMGKIGKLGRILGRRGLMPNPRTGTVVQPENIRDAVADAKKGRVEYRLDRTGMIHVPLGKASFEDDALLDNLTMLMDNVMRSRPAGVKGQFIRAGFLTTTMGPSVPLDVATTSALRVE